MEEKPKQSGSTADINEYIESAKRGEPLGFRFEDWAIRGRTKLKPQWMTFRHDWGQADKVRNPLVGFVMNDDGYFPAMRTKWLIPETDPEIRRKAHFPPIDSTRMNAQLEGFEPEPPRKYAFGVWPYKVETDRVYTLEEIENRILECDRNSILLSFDVKEGALRPDMLLVQINRAAVKVGHATRRGIASNVIMSRYAYEQLEKITGFIVDWESISRISPESTLNTIQVRTDIGRPYKWYIRPDWDDEHPIRVSYAGNMELDSGTFAIPMGDKTYSMGILYDGHQIPHWLDYYGAVRVISFPRV